MRMLVATMLGALSSNEGAHAATLGYLSERWAVVFALLVLAVLILLGWVSELRAELRRVKGERPRIF
jgi:hypothetical protein